MCGIIGITKTKKTNNLIGSQIYEALTRLEYRGYDSVGMAVISKDGIELAKDKGCILLYTVTENPGLHKRYVKYHGFSQGENKTRSFIKDLTDGDFGPMLWVKSQEVLDEEQDN